MPSIQGRHGGHSAVIRVAIYDAAKYNQHRQSNEPLFRGAQPFRTLIDTGATTTMISPNVVSALNLQAVGKVRMHSMAGDTYRRAYLFHVAFYVAPYQQYVQTDNDGAYDPGISRTLVCKKLITGGELPPATTFDVLLGMDVISTGNLTMRCDGMFSFDF